MTRLARQLAVAVLFSSGACGSEGPQVQPGEDAGSPFSDSGTSSSDGSQPDTDALVPLGVADVAPTVVDTNGGSRIVITGGGLSEVTSVAVGNVAVQSFEVMDDATISALTAAIPAATGLQVVVTSPAGSATWDGTLESWSPTQITDAVVYDAASGITAEESASAYEWSRLTYEIHPDWRWRDGNALNYLPSTGLYWMTGGWNGDPLPVGFGDAVTSSEVWSSPDGVEWTRVRTDEERVFPQRHCHSAIVWRDKLWMIGGDTWTGGQYNNDIWSSPDGRTWTREVEVTPWSYEEDGTLAYTSGRMMQVVGIYDDKLWMFGGQDGMSSLPAGHDHVTFHNDVWMSEDGVNWTEVLADTPWGEVDDSRPSGRGLINQMVEWHGQMWLVGGGRYSVLDPTLGELPAMYFSEVWSTTDGVQWQRHADAPWSGGNFSTVHVFDGRLFRFMGSNQTGNTAETWYTDDGESWTQVTPGLDSFPHSHADGTAVSPDGGRILLAGGNYSYGQGHVTDGHYTLDPDYSGYDKSSWQLQAFHGEFVDEWTDRSGSGLNLGAEGDTRPVLVPNAFGEGMAGIQFDGMTQHLQLDATESLAAGRSVFWVARVPWSRPFYAWTDYDLNPGETILGEGVSQVCSAGISEGEIQSNMFDGSLYGAVRVGSGLQVNAGEVRVAGFTHSTDGALQGYINGEAAGDPINQAYGTGCGWSNVGAGATAPSATHFGGALGALIILEGEMSTGDIAKIQQWAQGRFGALPAE